VAKAALRAFIAVRRGYQPRYADHDGAVSITPERLAAVIAAFVLENSEGGKRAQAVVAGLADVFAGTARVESGRINDPSRKYLDDICVRSAADPDVFEKAIEVRDKPVAVSDVHIFGKKCVDMGVSEAALTMVSVRQQALDVESLSQWASGYGIGLTLFHGWDAFIDQVLFWSELPKPLAANRAVGFIHARPIGVEASPDGVALWQTLTTE
jgi:hypothetical protein